MDALAAVGCISWVCWLINAFLRDCSNAFSISGSVRVGNHDEEGFRGIVANGIFISIGLGIAVTAVLLWQTEHIMRLLSVQPDVIHMTRRYLVIFILTIPCGLVYNITASLLRAYGNSSITFWSMTISTIVNVVLDLMFVLVFHWGVTGAAAAHLDRPVCVHGNCPVGGGKNAGFPPAGFGFKGGLEIDKRVVRFMGTNVF